VRRGVQLHSGRRPHRYSAGQHAQSTAQASGSKTFLDEYVIGQEQTKKKLAVAVYNHYKRIFMNRQKTSDDRADPSRTSC
jgi:ATP-dependent protease Clp ATPase subunit